MCKKAGQKKVCCVMERRACSGNAAACRAARLPVSIVSPDLGPARARPSGWKSRSLPTQILPRLNDASQEDDL